MRLEYEEKTFEGLTLSQETVCGMAFSDCTFVRCSFSGVRFQQCAFRDCAFFRCKIINPEPERTQAKHLRFEGCSLAGVRWEDFAVPGGFAGPLDQLSGCELKYNSFFQLRLDGFDFSGQAVMETVFDGCSLAQSSFRGCTLAGTLFTACDLRGADFRDAGGYCIDPRQNKLAEARFTLPEAVRLFDGLGVRIE